MRSPIRWVLSDLLFLLACCLCFPFAFHRPLHPGGRAWHFHKLWRLLGCVPWCIFPCDVPCLHSCYTPILGCDALAWFGCCCCSESWFLGMLPIQHQAALHSYCGLWTEYWRSCCGGVALAVIAFCSFENAFDLARSSTSSSAINEDSFQLKASAAFISL